MSERDPAEVLSLDGLRQEVEVLRAEPVWLSAAPLSDVMALLRRTGAAGAELALALAQQAPSTASPQHP